MLRVRLHFSSIHALQVNSREYHTDHQTRNTRPGGYLEIEDIYPLLSADDDTLKGTALEKYGILCVDGGKKMGINIDTAVITKKLMEEVGFVDVKQVIYKWPTNRWPADKQMKEIGKLHTCSDNPKPKLMLAQRSLVS